MESRRASPILIANILFSAVVVGVILGVVFRATGTDKPGAATPTARRPMETSTMTDAAGLLAADEPTPGEQRHAWEPPPGRPEMYSFADVAERVAPAVVTVFARRNVEGGADDGLFERFFGNREHPIVQGHGSGFVLREDGLVLTNNHVVNEAEEIKVRLKDGRELEAKVLGTDAATDIAVLRIEASNLPALRLGNSDALRVGDWVLAVGSPFRQALEHSVTAGIVSAKGRGNVGLAEYEEFLQTDAAINPGNSGGPLVNMHGDVIGINTAIATHNGGFQGVSFAIPSNFARQVIDALVTDGRVTRAWLGVQIQDVNPELARGLNLPRPEGVAIVEVYDDTPAAKAGVQSGDVVLAMDGEPTANTAHFRNRVSLSKPGQSIDLDILRDGKRRTVRVELKELTENILADVRGRGEPQRGAPSDAHFGLELAELSPELRARHSISDRVSGLVVADVARGSIAADAGLDVGDVIRAVNRRNVDSLPEFTKAVENAPADRPILLQVKRGDQSFFVTLERPS